MTQMGQWWYYTQLLSIPAPTGSGTYFTTVGGPDGQQKAAVGRLDGH